MDISVRQEESASIVRLEGERATLQNAWEFRNVLSEIVERGEKNILVDLSPVNFADSSFLGVLIHFFKVLVRQDGELKVVGLNSSLRILFEMAGVDEGVAKEAMRLASQKLPIDPKFVTRETVYS